MKKTLLFFASLLTTSIIIAQCNPSDYDFGGLGFGVSPDPLLGESFDVAQINEPYNDIIYVKVPTSAADIDETLPEQAPIDSIIFIGVSFVLDGTEYTSEQIGLEVVCNNNGDSPEPCSFLGGNQYCANLQGTPTVAGEFQMIITVEGWSVLFGTPFSQQIDFDQYTFIVEDDATSVDDLPALAESLMQNIPNPASGLTKIPFRMSKQGKARLVITNLLGEIVLEELVMAKQGTNNWTVDASELENGLYLYSIETGGKKLTKRMIVNR